MKVYVVTPEKKIEVGRIANNDWVKNLFEVHLDNGEIVSAVKEGWNQFHYFAAFKRLDEAKEFKGAIFSHRPAYIY